MRHKSWTYTRYQDGKPVATEKNVDHDGAIARIRAAIAGDDQIFDEMVAEGRSEHPGTPDAAFVAHAAFLARAA